MRVDSNELARLVASSDYGGPEPAIDIYEQIVSLLRQWTETVLRKY